MVQICTYKTLAIITIRPVKMKSTTSNKTVISLLGVVCTFLYLQRDTHTHTHSNTKTSHSCLLTEDINTRILLVPECVINCGEH